MSNYRRLISYIYAYQGGVKGKNIGFAKLETRNNQCRIQVSVRKIFVGSQDIGVFLLSDSNSEIYLGKIFLRNGVGEFRTSVSVNQVGGTNQSIDQCYGLTIHNMDDSWQNYTTIWEDAVAHAAEVELEEAVSELAEEQEMSQAPDSLISESKLEEVVTNHKSSIVETIEAEIQAQSQREEKNTTEKSLEEEIPSTFVQPQKEEPQTILWPKEEENPVETPDEEGKQEETVAQEMKAEPKQPEPRPMGQWSQPAQSMQSVQSTQSAQPMQPVQSTQPAQPMQPVQSTQPAQPAQPEGRPQTMRQFQPAAPFRLGPRNQPVRQFPAAQWQQARGQSQSWGQNAAWGQIQQPYNQSQAAETLRSQQPVQQPIQQPVQQAPQQTPPQPTQQSGQNPQPMAWEQQQRQQLEQLEREEPKEEVGMDNIWQHFCKTSPKIQAFDYNGECEILTIKPQDIGLLPREVWTYGNNSFLLHGYYNHRYLIMARLGTPNGKPRYLLGVPGHYYSNERYMATMFGFPNFVLSKTQPAGDSRFGYWYTDVRLGS